MKAVANATPLIALSIIGELDLLAILFEEVLVPPSVWEEVVLQGEGRPEHSIGVRSTLLTIP